MQRLCRRDMEGALPIYNCNCDERTEESKYWHLIIVEWISIERKTEILLEMTLGGHHSNVEKIDMTTTTKGGRGKEVHELKEA